MTHKFKCEQCGETGELTEPEEARMTIARYIMWGISAMIGFVCSLLYLEGEFGALAGLALFGFVSVSLFGALIGRVFSKTICENCIFPDEYTDNS